MLQFSYCAVWNFAEQIKDGSMSLTQANNRCKLLASDKARELGQLGYHVHRFTLRNQTRMYWAMGEYCGLSCTAYGVNASK